jgi:hypothetical protein
VVAVLAVENTFADGVTGRRYLSRLLRHFAAALAIRH